MLATLVDSITFFVLSTGGTALAFVGWRMVYGALPADLWKEGNIIAVGIVLMSTVALLLFSRRKEEYTEKRLEWNRIAGGMLAHDLRGSVQML